jgi:hypothetical protein
MNSYSQKYAEFKHGSIESRNIDRAFHFIFWSGHIIAAFDTADHSRYVIFSVSFLKNCPTALDTFASLSCPPSKILHSPFYLFHGRSLPFYHLLRPQSSATLPSHDILFSSIFGLRSAIEPLTANLFDAPFAFSDAPTLAPISQIVLAPDADSI